MQDFHHQQEELRRAGTENARGTAIHRYGCFCDLGVLVVAVLTITALLVGVYDRPLISGASHVGKISTHSHVPIIHGECSAPHVAFLSKARKLGVKDSISQGPLQWTSTCMHASD